MDNPEAGSRPPAGTPGSPAAAPITGPGDESPRWPETGPGPSSGPWPAGPQPPGYGGYAPRRPTNGLAIAALVVGGVSFVSCPLIGAVAVYLGNRARTEIRATGEEGDSFALAGVILGWCAVGVATAMVLFAVVYFGFFAVLLGVFGTGQQ